MGGFGRRRNNENGAGQWAGPSGAGVHIDTGTSLFPENWPGTSFSVDADWPYGVHQLPDAKHHWHRTVFWRWPGLLGNNRVGAIMVPGDDIYTAQVLFATVWLEFFIQGPVEWLWGCLTDGEFKNNRRVPIATIQTS